MNPIDWIRDLYHQPPPGSICNLKGRWVYCPRGVEHAVLATMLLVVVALVLAFIVSSLIVAWRAL